MQNINIIQDEEFKKICSKYIRESALVYSKIIYLKQIEMGIDLIDMDLCSINFIKILVNDDLVDEDGDMITLSDKGRMLMHLLRDNLTIIDTESPALISSIVTVEKQSYESVEDWIDEWLNIWKDESGKFFKAPADGGTRSLGAARRDVLSNMITFLDKYSDLFSCDNPKTLIMKATRNYVNTFRKVNFAYCTKSLYFIMKQNNFKKIRSLLAEECDKIKEEGIDDVSQEEFNSFIKSIN